MSISPMNTSLSQVSMNQSYSVRVGSLKNVFKQGHIFLNGKKVLIGASIRDTARNINRMSAQTGVKAKVVRDARGSERLVLISSKKTVNISDPKRILADLFSKNKIGKGDDKLIQIEGNKGIGNRVKINYSNNKPTTQLNQHLKLSDKVAANHNGISGLHNNKLQEFLLDDQILPEEEPQIDNILKEKTIVNDIPLEELEIEELLSQTLTSLNEVSETNEDGNSLSLKVIDDGIGYLLSSDIQSSSTSIDDEVQTTSVKNEVQEVKTDRSSKIAREVIKVLDKGDFKNQRIKNKEKIIQAVASGLKQSPLSFEQIESNFEKVASLVSNILRIYANPVSFNFKNKLKIIDMGKVVRAISRFSVEDFEKTIKIPRKVILEYTKKTEPILDTLNRSNFRRLNKIVKNILRGLNSSTSGEAHYKVVAMAKFVQSRVIGNMKNSGWSKPIQDSISGALEGELKNLKKQQVLVPIVWAYKQKSSSGDLLKMRV